MKFLLVEPDFPITTKSKNHKNFLPIGLVKIAALKISEGHDVLLIRGNKSIEQINKLAKKILNYKSKFIPDEIWITSLFTYWIKNVEDSVSHYRNIYSNTKIVVGGIAASLFGIEKTKEFTKCDAVHKGVIPEAEFLDKSHIENIYNIYLKEVDFQILHAQRGCFRKCEFCGTWKIEPEVQYLDSIRDMIFKRNIIFYDNNFLDNPNIHEILDELIELKKDRIISWCECQSGLDGRIITTDVTLPHKLKKAGFRNLRIAWDSIFSEYSKIRKQLNCLTNNSKLYKEKSIEIFMLYNWDISFTEMEKKRAKCFEWGVQISDCRFRSLDQKIDNYKPRKLGQTDDYYIHPNWNDFLIKQFRRNVRRHNICVRHGFFYYSKDLEQKKIPKEIIGQIVKAKTKNQQKELLTRHKIIHQDLSKPMTKTEVMRYVKQNNKLL